MKKERKRPGRPRSELPDVAEPNAFARWLADRQIDIDAVAKLLGVDRSSVYGWRRGNRPPSRKMATRISRLTDGEVGPDSWD